MMANSVVPETNILNIFQLTHPQLVHQIMELYNMVTITYMCCWISGVITRPNKNHFPSIFIHVAPTCIIGHPWNTSFHFSFLILQPADLLGQRKNLLVYLKTLICHSVGVLFKVTSSITNCNNLPNVNGNSVVEIHANYSTTLYFYYIVLINTVFLNFPLVKFLVFYLC
jgi:hypothetical protein